MMSMSKLRILAVVCSGMLFIASSALQLHKPAFGQMRRIGPIRLVNSGSKREAYPQIDKELTTSPIFNNHISAQMVAAVSLGPNFPRYVAHAVMQSDGMKQLITITPPQLKGFVKFINPWELMAMLLFQFSYSKILKYSHKLQTVLWKVANKGEPHKWKSSILGFVHERSEMLSKLITFNYFAKLGCAVLVRLGFNIQPEFPGLLSRISYALFMAQFLDMFKSRFLRSFFPKVGDSKRQTYMVDKSASVVIWTVGGLIACEMLSTFLKIPLSSTLAFGGVGGLAAGLSLRDMAANFIGGLMLLVNEPFTPGDMVTFQNEKMEVSVVMHLLLACVVVMLHFLRCNLM